MTASLAAELLDELRRAAPLVQCITNSVVTNFTANALLAIGAAPAMADVVGEAGPFARIAGGVLVNLGTPTPEQRAAAAEAVGAANETGTPWVLDPVAVGVLPLRSALAARLIEQHPAAIRGNASEVLALAGAGGGGRGVDASDSTGDAAHTAVRLARERATVVAVSGPEDLITDGERVLRVANGDVLLTRITGGGCALGAVVTAFVAARGTASTLDAVTAAHVVYGVAAQRAADGTSGPGTFGVRLLDALDALTPADVAAQGRVRTESIAGPSS